MVPTHLPGSTSHHTPSCHLHCHTVLPGLPSHLLSFGQFLSYQSPFRFQPLLRALSDPLARKVLSPHAPQGLCLLLPQPFSYQKTTGELLRTAGPGKTSLRCVDLTPGPMFQETFSRPHSLTKKLLLGSAVQAWGPSIFCTRGCSHIPQCWRCPVSGPSPPGPHSKYLAISYLTPKEVSSRESAW